MSAPAQTVIRSHSWEQAGLGVAPFRFVLMTTAEGQGDGCQYCGTGIKYRFHCVSSDGKRFHVGCDCIARCHMPAETIVVAAKRALKEHKTRVRREGEAARRKAEREARQAIWAAEREANLARLATDPLYLRIKALVGVSNYGDGTNGQGGNEFLRNMRDAMEKFGQLTERQEASAVRIMDRIEQEPARKAASFHLGAEGERKEIKGTVELARCIHRGLDRYDPDRWLNKIRTDDGAAVAWFGAYGLKEGEHVTGTATIKALGEYQGEKQTMIKNPRWKAKG